MVRAFAVTVWVAVRWRLDRRSLAKRRGLRKLLVVLDLGDSRARAASGRGELMGSIGWLVGLVTLVGSQPTITTVAGAGPGGGSGGHGPAAAGRARRACGGG